MSSEPPDWASGHEAGLAYHAKLLADPHRMAAYERALRTLVRPGDVVLDLGAGTGILAMLAARRGAARVHAVESMPVAGVARQLIEANGLADRVVVHQADATKMPPAEPVDLVVSDFMGRFVVDDGMLWAVEASRAWMKPDARFCPAEVRLMIAPVAVGHFDSIDTFEFPLLGVDLRPALPYALNYVYGMALKPEVVLAVPARYHTLAPPDRGGSFDRTVRFTAMREGRLRGLAGWFEATLADGVELSTEPGVDTHWSQILFPLPAVEISPGDVVEIRLRLDEDAPQSLRWCWSGAIHPRSGPALAFDFESEQRLGERPPGPADAPPGPDADPFALNQRGAEVYQAGQATDAVTWFERAAAALRPEHDDDPRTAGIWENVGLGYVVTGRVASAPAPFLRALDGDLASREQSLRFLVEAAFYTNRPHDGERLLRLYEETFGPHPSGRRFEPATEGEEE